jgi:2,3,4,5-tetrahydropyridine-2-carboxylate N-succinyltransferase
MADQTVTAAHGLESIVDEAFERRSEIFPSTVGPILADALEQIIGELNAGRLRVAEKTEQGWVTHQWIKKAVLLYFRTHDNHVMPASGRDAWFDKVPLRFNGYTEAQFREGGFRVVPPATVRTGAFIGRNVVLMPSYVNIGAYVDEGTMVDTWATVGSCAQIGKNVHLSGGGRHWRGPRNRCRPTRRSSRTTASSARARRSSRA